MEENMKKLFLKLTIFFLLSAIGMTNVFGKENMTNYKLQVATRALVVKNKELLLVSNDGNFWYTPGGRMNADETLSECVVREVKEETGIDIEANEIISVYDFFDRKDSLHKVEIYFTTTIKSSAIPKKWLDQDGPVKFSKFFSLEELGHMKNIAPGFLKEGRWLKHSVAKIYEGFETK